MNSNLSLEEMSQQELICYFVVQQRNQGFTLPYLDYETIERWLKLAQGDQDLLLLILSEELPPLYSNRRNGGSPLLRSIDHKIVGRIKELRA